MKDAIAAIAGITILMLAALVMGFNGSVLQLSIGLIAAIGGYQARDKKILDKFKIN